MKNAMQKFYDFLDQPIRTWSRIVLALLPLFLFLAYQFPLWRISMEAPQYPNGLYMDVWAYKLEGGNDGQHIQEINTLNHYIGMHQIVPADFQDLDWMPFALGVLIILAWRVAAIGNVRSLIDLTVITTYVLGFMGARFVYRLYVYGHELDPDAPFDVEPFTPVIIGTKQIANFTTHSMPQIGTLWITLFFAGVVVLCLYHLIAGRRAAVRAEKQRVEHVGAAETHPAHG